MNLRTAPPLLFRVAKKMNRRNIRGGYRLMSLAEKAGMLDGVMWNQIDNRIRIAFPLQHEGRSWDSSDLIAYEPELLGLAAQRLAGWSDITLIDCGAHLGVVSALLCARCPKITRVIALEPNDRLLEVLRLNIAALPVRGEVVAAAVSNFSGAGRLENPPDNMLDQARFLIPGEGPIPVVTIDSLGVRGGAVAIKIDVEGGEPEVIEGAAETIRSAESCMVTFEAHPQVFRRTRRDPAECLRRLESIRKFEYTVAENGQKLSPTLDRMFDGISGETERLWNVVGCSQQRAGNG